MSSTAGKSVLVAVLFFGLMGCLDKDSAGKTPPVDVIPPNTTPAIESVEFSYDQLELKMDRTVRRVEFSVSPTDADTSNLGFSSTNTDIITVDDEGNLTPIDPGNASIVVTDSGIEIASLPVTVRKVLMYSIGNSHTQDFGSAGDFVQLASSQGIEIENDWHVNCGRSIERILLNPTATCVSSTYGNYQNALSQVAFDIVTVQPFAGLTGAGETEAVMEMIEYIRQSASANADIYIYYTWPSNPEIDLSDFDYTERWLSPFFENSSFSYLRRGFVEYLKAELAANNVTVAGFIPAGQALNEIHQVASVGGLVNYQGAGELYRDALHLNNMGRFAAGSTVLFSIFENLEVTNYNLPAYVPSINWPTDRALDTAMRMELMDIVRQVVANEQ